MRHLGVIRGSAYHHMLLLLLADLVMMNLGLSSIGVSSRGLSRVNCAGELRLLLLRVAAGSDQCRVQVLLGLDGD